MSDTTSKDDELRDNRLRLKIQDVIAYHNGPVDEQEVEDHLKLINQYGTQERIDGMEQARSRVLGRTEIPADAKNPTRDHIVILGEEIAQVIADDIATLKNKQEVAN